MSRTRFWTILVGSEPTAFRARDRDALVPTLKQLQRQHPQAIIRWFEYGQLFDSPEAALAAREQAARERRPPGWRPGGDHRDPRARYELTRDEKRRRFKARRERQRSAGAGPGARGTSGPASPAAAGAPRRPPRRPRRTPPEE